MLSLCRSLFKDDNTIDIHGSAIFFQQRNNSGWPPLANLVLNASKSANYELTQLPYNVTVMAWEELQKLQFSLTLLYRDQSKDKIFGKNHSSISMGFKAPVSMTLLPFLVAIFKEVRFIRKCWFFLSLLLLDSIIISIYSHFSTLLQTSFVTDATCRSATIEVPFVNFVSVELMRQIVASHAFSFLHRVLFVGFHRRYVLCRC